MRGAVPPPGWPHRPALVVVVLGMLVTAALSLVTAALYSHNEKRLLELRIKEVGSLLSASLPSRQTVLASAAALADSTNADKQKFARFITPYVGAPPSHPFLSVSLWRLRSPQRGPVTMAGAPPSLSASGAAARRLFETAARTPTLSVIGLGQPALTRIGYAYATPGPASAFVAYGENAIPATRRSPLERNSAFSDLDYALYFGTSQRARNLLVTSLGHLPVHGHHATMAVPFGNATLTLVVAPHGSLAGTVPQRLPWIITIVGVLLTLGAGALTARLSQRRRIAEGLANRLERAVTENQRLYAEQRTIAQTLQHALLPDQLPQIRGAETSARYEPGEPGVEIGGDWYDVIPLDDARVLLVVGDVSGHGLRAATTMASLRFAIHAYAAQNDPPAAILTKLSRLLDVRTAGQLATVLCAVVDMRSHQLTVTSAGHLPPLLINGEHAEYVDCDVGLPIGVQRGASYVATTTPAPASATVLAFTDGLIERRGEDLDRSLARLQAAARADHERLDELLGRLLAELHPASSQDDTAILGFRWVR